MEATDCLLSLTNGKSQVGLRLWHFHKNTSSWCLRKKFEAGGVGELRSMNSGWTYYQVEHPVSQVHYSLGAMEAEDTKQTETQQAAATKAVLQAASGTVALAAHEAAAE